MGERQRILVDSDAFVGWLYDADAHHKRATAIFNKIKRKRLAPITTSLVVAETATVLSNRQGQNLARVFLDLIAKYPVIHIDEQLQQEALEFFKAQEKKGTSVVDCTNVVVMRRFKIPTIFSFDKFYSKQLGMKTSI
ncbi:MAG: PIN domain-containing protein [Nitrososphaera sp.]|nr:PIN domain-containing protein [Nitrososphaera sp.]